MEPENLEKEFKLDNFVQMFEMENFEQQLELENLEQALLQEFGAEVGAGKLGE